MDLCLYKKKCGPFIIKAKVGGAPARHPKKITHKFTKMYKSPIQK